MQLYEIIATIRKINVFITELKRSCLRVHLPSIAQNLVKIQKSITCYLQCMILIRLSLFASFHSLINADSKNIVFDKNDLCVYMIELIKVNDVNDANGCD